MRFIRNLSHPRKRGVPEQVIGARLILSRWQERRKSELSMDNLTKPISSKSATLVCVCLRLLANQHPEFEPLLLKCIQRIQSKYILRGMDQDASAIFEAIRNGYHTSDEISKRTKIPRRTVFKRLTDLHSKGIVYWTRQPASLTGKQDNRRRLFWLSTDAPPRRKRKPSV